MDFLTDLPLSDTFTCILLAVDRFAKACKLFPLTGLPTTLEYGEALIQRVFQIYGIPVDILSDRGPQFK